MCVCDDNDSGESGSYDDDEDNSVLSCCLLINTTRWDGMAKYIEELGFR